MVMHRTAIVTRIDADETMELPVLTPEALPRKSFILRIISGPQVGATLTLDPTSPPHAVLGQASSCAIPLTDPHVSRRHIALTATATHMLLVDLGSTNGTFVNGVLVREARLQGGETVTIGRTVLGVETDEPGAANVPGTLPPPPDDARAAETIAPPASDVAPLADTKSRPAPPDFLVAVLAEHLPFTDARQRVVAEFERRYVEELLARHHGNVTHAARASGLAHRYFQLVRARSR
jgi:predicted component of type VI protein secretion system